MEFEAGGGIGQSNVEAAGNNEAVGADFSNIVAQQLGNAQNGVQLPTRDGGNQSRRGGGRDDDDRVSNGRDDYGGDGDGRPDFDFGNGPVRGRNGRRDDDGGRDGWPGFFGRGRDRGNDRDVAILPHGPSKGHLPWQADGPVPWQANGPTPWQGNGPTPWQGDGPAQTGPVADHPSAWSAHDGSSGSGPWQGHGYTPVYPGADGRDEDPHLPFFRHGPGDGPRFGLGGGDGPWPPYPFGRPGPWDPAAALNYVLAREAPGVRAPQYVFNPDAAPLAFGFGRAYGDTLLDGSLAGQMAYAYFSNASARNTELDWLQLKLTIFTRTSDEAHLLRWMRAQGSSLEEVLRSIWALRQSQLVDRWNEPGAAYASGPLRPADAAWLGQASARASWVPEQIANHLRAQQFNDFVQFRRELWRAAAATPELAAQFSEANLARMRNGSAPIAPAALHSGDLYTYQIFHQVPASHGGDVYDMSNMLILSPLALQMALDPTNEASVLNFMYANAARLRRRKRRRWMAGQQQRGGGGGRSFGFGSWARRKWRQFRQGARKPATATAAAPRRPAPGIPVVRLTRQGPEPLLKPSVARRRMRPRGPLRLSWQPPSADPA